MSVTNTTALPFPQDTATADPALMASSTMPSPSMASPSMASPSMAPSAAPPPQPPPKETNPALSSSNLATHAGSSIEQSEDARPSMPPPPADAHSESTELDASSVTTPPSLTTTPSVETPASLPTAHTQPPPQQSPYSAPPPHQMPPHPFYPSAHAPPQHVYHPHHPAFQYQPSFPYPSAPYFPPHPMYQMHNWPPTPAVSHPQFQPPHPSFYHWPPQATPPHVQQHHRAQSPVPTQPLPPIPIPSATQEHFDPTRNHRRNSPTTPNHSSPRSQHRHASRPPHPPDHYPAQQYVDRDSMHLQHHMGHHALSQSPHHTSPYHPNSRRGGRRRNGGDGDRDGGKDRDAVDGDSRRDKNYNGKAADVEVKSLVGHDPLVASSSNVSVASTSSGSDRKHGGGGHGHGGGGHKANSRPPQGNDASSSPDRELQSLTADLDKSARKAVANDEVTLALLLTSWANSLAEARHHVQTPATQFETVFHASHVLEIVANSVLCSNPAPDSPVLKALVALFGFVLYGDHRLHTQIASLVVDVNGKIPKNEVGTQLETAIRERDAAISRTLAFLKDVALNMRAYADVLPPSPDVRDKESAIANAGTHVTGANAASGPAGPDPTKAVERSMDAWRRTVARLQGEMALIVVLKKALVSMDSELRTDGEGMFEEPEGFFVALRQAVRKHIEGDLAARIDRLNAVYWADVTRGAETTVYQATRERAVQWLGQFESARTDVEQQLDDAGIGFGPSARVSEDKLDVLLSASAGVAALVSCQQHAFTWASDTSRLLSSMVTAVRCLEGVDEGRLCPNKDLREKFFTGLDAAYAALDQVVNWSFESLHDKVLGSLGKSCGAEGVADEESGPPKVRLLRFEEPPKTPVGDGEGGENGMAMNRRKPRHARMKSSPDALLHLNARFDEYSDEDSDLDREIEYNDDKGEEAVGEVAAKLVFVSGTEERDVVEDGDDGVQLIDSKTVNSSSDIGVTMVMQDTNGVGNDEEGDDDDYDGQSVVEYDEADDDDEADDRDIIVHDVVEDEAKPKKVSHSSHIRSMSVDGIPF